MNYLQEFFESFVSKLDDKNIITDFNNALKCLQKQVPKQDFKCMTNSDYDGAPNDFIEDVLTHRQIHILPSTVIDVSDDGEQLVRLDEDLYVDITDLYENDVIVSEDFYVKAKDLWFINPEIDDGEMADYISDTTGFLVYSVDYEIL